MVFATAIGTSDFCPKGSPLSTKLNYVKTTNMPLYYDLISPTGQLLEDETFTSIDRARDVAFDLAQELGMDVYIRENFGAARNFVEIVEG